FSVHGRARPASLMHSPHEKCLISLEWQAACIAIEQGWDEDWVQSQLGEAQKTRMLGEVSAGRSVGQVEPPQGGWREEASSAADHGKQRASLPSGAGPSKRPWGCGLGTGIKFSGAPAFDHRGLSLQVGGGANSGVDGMGGGALMGKGGLRCSMGREGGVGVGMEHFSVGSAKVSARGMGLVGASDAVGGAAHGGGRGAGNGTEEWSAVSRVG
ncbi:hypothetical protein C0989_008648, partial [Termitomyces sp. Mn162]